MVGSEYLAIILSWKNMVVGFMLPVNLDKLGFFSCFHNLNNNYCAKYLRGEGDLNFNLLVKNLVFFC